MAAVGDLTVHVNVETVGPLLVRFSEWLDGQGLTIGDTSEGYPDAVPRKAPGEDKRSHEQLVRDFLAEDWQEATHCPQGGKHEPLAAGDANDGGAIHCRECQAPIPRDVARRLNREATR